VTGVCEPRRVIDAFERWASARRALADGVGEETSLPVTTSYPGVYIEELPSSTHTVSAAPTSITVFVGYTNPFWQMAPKATLPPFGVATELFSFADYQAMYGGFFNSPFLPDYVGQAVFEFFQNGGSNAYVVALKAGNYFDPTKVPPANDTGDQVLTATAVLGTNADNYTLSALQPVGLAGPPQEGVTMQVEISNLIKTAADDDTADVTIVYGSTVETYRRLLITDMPAKINAVSALAAVSENGTPPAAYTGLSGTTPFTYGSVPASGLTMIDPLAYGPVFEANASLDKVSIFNLMALPGMTDPAVLAQALAYCESKRAFYVMDPPQNAVADTLAISLPDAPTGAATMESVWDGATIPVSANGAIYFPYLQTTDPVTGAASNSPPSGYVAGIFAREDTNRGVWKSPAGLETTIKGTTGVVDWGRMTDPQQGVLNELGVNVLRTFPGIGTVVYGARTLVSENSAYEQWKYVAVRRMALFLEQSLYASLGWAVFEPNDVPLWNALTQEVQAFMLGLFRQGAFQGATADQAFNVQCDSTTTSQADIDNGIVNILVAFAPLKPAEFVVIQIAQLAGQTQS
jgi:phage tail sheath protein FI